MLNRKEKPDIRVLLVDCFSRTRLYKEMPTEKKEPFIDEIAKLITELNTQFTGGKIAKFTNWEQILRIAGTNPAMQRRVDTFRQSMDQLGAPFTESRKFYEQTLAAKVSEAILHETGGYTRRKLGRAGLAAIHQEVGSKPSTEKVQPGRSATSAKYKGTAGAHTSLSTQKTGV